MTDDQPCDKTIRLSSARRRRRIVPTVSQHDRQTGSHEQREGNRAARSDHLCRRQQVKHDGVGSRDGQQDCHHRNGGGAAQRPASGPDSVGGHQGGGDREETCRQTLAQRPKINPLKSGVEPRVTQFPKQIEERKTPDEERQPPRRRKSGLPKARPAHTPESIGNCLVHVAIPSFLSLYRLIPQVPPVKAGEVIPYSQTSSSAGLPLESVCTTELGSDRQKPLTGSRSGGKTHTIQVGIVGICRKSALGGEL